MSDTELQNLIKENKLLKMKLKWFEEQYRLQQNKLFGKSSEKINSDQLSLFNEAESETKPETPEPCVEEISYKRKKKQGQKEEKFKDLPVETIEYHLPKDEQNCDCGSKLHVMSKQIRKELKIVPAQLSVVEHVQHIYSCRECEKNDINTNVKTAKMPKPPISGSIASSSVIAYITNEKFVKGIPLYRQEQEWRRMGVNLSRQNMANWMIKSADNLLKPIYNKMKQHLLENDIIHADETTLQVLKEPGRSANTNSYMWLYRTGRDCSPIVLYDYQTTRAGKHAARFLNDFKGYIHTDGYSGYNIVPDITLVGCWAHARRYFVEAIKALPPKNNDKLTASEEGLAFCNKLFEIEKELLKMSPKERYEKRLEKSKPIIDDFKIWLQYQSKRAAPKTLLGKAVYYCRNQWDKLTAFLLDGRLEIDNNRAERAIKPFVIGRKNWLFSNSPKGASSSAIIYSIVETAKENNLNPFYYLKYLFDNLPNIDENNNNLDEFMPWASSLPQSCKIT